MKFLLNNIMKDDPTVHSLISGVVRTPLEFQQKLIYCTHKARPANIGHTKAQETHQDLEVIDIRRESQ